jgi:RNA polymerase sigma-70 factor (ECF subfamily)
LRDASLRAKSNLYGGLVVEQSKKGVNLSIPVTVENDAPNTERLLDLARAGDADAFGELCRVHETRLLRQAMMLCGNPDTAEDLAQETLVEAWKSVRRFKGRCQLFTWLCAILFNRYRNKLRARRPIPFSDLMHHEREEIETRPESADDSSPARAAQEHEQRALVRECLEALPRKQQQVIYLRFFAGESLESIAGALGCSIGTVKSRLFYGMERLRTMHLSGSQQAPKLSLDS